MRFVRKVGPRGNMTVPSDVLEAARAKPGDILEFEIVRVHRQPNQEPPQ